MGIAIPGVKTLKNYISCKSIDWSMNVCVCINEKLINPTIYGNIINNKGGITNKWGKKTGLFNK